MSNPYSELIEAFRNICEPMSACYQCNIYGACNKISELPPSYWTEQTIKDFLGVKKNETSAE